MMSLLFYLAAGAPPDAGEGPSYKTRLKDVRVPMPNSWADAAGREASPSERAMFTDLDEELHQFQKVKSKWHSSAEKFNTEMADFKQANADHEEDYKDTERSVDAAIKRQAKSSFLQTEPTDAPKETLDDVSRKLNALKDKMESDAEKIEKEAGQVGPSSFLQEPDSDTSEDKADEEKSKMAALKKKIDSIQVGDGPKNWVEAAKFASAKSPIQENLEPFKNMDEEMAIYGKMKQKWLENMRSLNATLNDDHDHYTHEISHYKDLIAHPRDPASFAPSFLQTGEHAAEFPSDLGTRSFETGGAALERAERRRDAQLAGPEASGEQEAALLQKMRHTQSVLQEDAKKYKHQAAVDGYMSGKIGASFLDTSPDERSLSAIQTKLLSQADFLKKDVAKLVNPSSLLQVPDDADRSELPDDDGPVDSDHLHNENLQMVSDHMKELTSTIEQGNRMFKRVVDNHNFQSSVAAPTS